MALSKKQHVDCDAQLAGLANCLREITGIARRNFLERDFRGLSIRGGGFVRRNALGETSMGEPSISACVISKRVVVMI